MTTLPHHRGALVLMVGPPGSGKSTLAAKRVPPECRFSLDQFRAMLAGDITAQDATDHAAAMLDTLIEYRMAAGLLTVVDSTNARAAHRTRLRNIAVRSRRPVVAVRMHTPLHVCQARQQHRRRPYPGANDRPVPPEVIAKMWAAIDQDPPLPHECDIVVHVHPTDPDRMIAQSRHPADWAQDVLAEHDMFPYIDVIRADARVPWSAPRG